MRYFRETFFRYLQEIATNFLISLVYFTILHKYRRNIQVFDFFKKNITDIKRKIKNFKKYGNNFKW